MKEEKSTEPVIIPANQNKTDQSYWAIVRRQFNKNRLAVWSLRFLYFILFIALMADFIANEKPLYAKYEGKTYFPVFRSYLVNAGLADWQDEIRNAEWKILEYDRVVWPPVPYRPTNIDFLNSNYVGPFDDQVVPSPHWRHRLGTDELGRDVLSGMIHATRIAMLVGVVSMSIAAFFGIIFGAMAGYFGDSRLQMSRIRLLLNIFFLVIAIFYSFGVRSYILSDALGAGLMAFLGQFLISLFIFMGIMLIPNLLAIPLKKVAVLGKRINIALDIIVMRFIEILTSIPTLLLILAIVALTQPSIIIIMVIIGITGWTGIARFIRGELLRVRSLEYIEAAQALGYSEARIIFKHAIPNSLTPVLIAIAFGVASAILIESTLSFLGIGVPAEVVTWGSLLSDARNVPDAWWLAIFPGFAIFITVTIFNLIGDGLADALDPRLKK
ncbi:MAG: ABC transporter permease [Chitinophagaceae bacterium]|nr:MAG: ABC transporter permease [Chitinophagaceae bacterium]